MSWQALGSTVRCRAIKEDTSGNFHKQACADTLADRHTHPCTDTTHVYSCQQNTLFLRMELCKHEFYLWYLCLVIRFSPHLSIQTVKEVSYGSQLNGSSSHWDRPFPSDALYPYIRRLTEVAHVGNRPSHQMHCICPLGPCFKM